MQPVAPPPDAARRLMQLAREIRHLADHEPSEARFLAELLPRLLSAVGGTVGGVWVRSSQVPGETFALQVDQGLRAAAQELGGLATVEPWLVRVRQEGQALLQRPQDARGPHWPAGQMQLLGPLHVGSEVVAIVHLLLRGEMPDGARLGALQFLEQIGGLVSRSLQRRREGLTQAADATSTAAQAPAHTESTAPPAVIAAPPVITATPSTPAPAVAAAIADPALLLRLHHSLSLSEVIRLAVNDGRAWLGCDRVSIALQQGPRTVIRGISGQGAVNARANLVKHLATLVGHVLQSGERFSYTGDVGPWPPAIEQALADYLHESRSRMVLIVPLVRPDPLFNETSSADEPARAETARPSPLGALVIEQVTDTQPRGGLDRQVDRLAEHLAAALHNARAHEDIFLLPLWRAIGAQVAKLRGRRLAWCAVAVAACLSVALGLAFIPWEYRVEGRGQLMPAVRQNIFAPSDGDVAEVLVRGGERVKRGDVLLRLRNDPLQTDLVTVQHQLLEKRAELRSLQAELDQATAQADRAAEVRLQGKLVQTRLEIDGAAARLALLEQRRDQLTVTAPLDGVVATFQVEQLLTQRPVKRGDLLLEVMDDQGPWRLEVDLPESRLGHVARAIRRADEMSSASAGEQSDRSDAAPLPVEFVLATATEVSGRGTVERIATRSNLSEADGAIVQLHVAVPADQLAERRIGAEVTARVECGRRSLGYVLFGDVIEFVQRRLWW